MPAIVRELGQEVIVNIRPVSELRNHYSDVERDTADGPVFLTKNGYGSMVLMGIDQYEYLTGNNDDALDAADRQAKATSARLTHEEVFGSIRKGLQDACTAAE